MSIELEVRVQVVRACSVPINGGVHDNAYPEAWFLGFLIFLFVSYRLMLYRGTKLCVRRRDQDCSEMSEYRVGLLSAELAYCVRILRVCYVCTEVCRAKGRIPRATSRSGPSLAEDQGSPVDRHTRAHLVSSRRSVSADNFTPGM